MPRLLIILAVFCGLAACQSDSATPEGQRVEGENETFRGVQVRAVNFRVQEVDIYAGILQNRAQFDLEITNPTRKRIRAVQGECVFSDVFDEEKARFQCDITGPPLPVGPGKKVRTDDSGVTLNRFNPGHQWLMSTPARDLKFRYLPSQVLFADGTIAKQ